MSVRSTFHRARRGALQRFVAEHPIRAGKILAIALVMLLTAGGLVQILGGNGVIDRPLLIDGQFLAIVLIPLSSLALAGGVAFETLAGGYRSLRTGRSVHRRPVGQRGYLVVRTMEIVIASLSIGLVAVTGAVLAVESVSAPADVGLMVGVLVVGFAMLVVSFVRELIEVATGPDARIA